MMRALPSGDESLVARVVAQTLASLEIDLDALVQDAEDRVDTTRSSIDERGRKIVELEAEISGHRTAISSLERELAEVSGVRNRLRRAMNPETSGSSPGRERKAEQAGVEQASM